MTGALWLLALLAGCGGAPDEPAPPEATPCEDAWVELSTLRAAMADIIGDEAKAPDESSFLTACRALPAPARPCLSPTRALEDPACEAHMTAIDEDLRDLLSLDAAPTPN